MTWVDSKDGQPKGDAQQSDSGCAVNGTRHRRTVDEGKQQVGPDGLRIFELETENQQLTRLVAELLLKNQRLREPN